MRVWRCTPPRPWRPEFEPADYFGYPRRQYRRLRELEAFLRRVVDLELDRTARSAYGYATSPAA